MSKLILIILPALLGCAAVFWDDAALFSRTLLLCSDRVGRKASNPGFHSGAAHCGRRDCSRKIGNGSCTDTRSNTFNYCSGPANTYSLEACQFIAKSNKDVAGIQYVKDGEDAYCLLLLDEESVSFQNKNVGETSSTTCPDHFAFHRESEISGGYGHVTGIDSAGQCYSCSSNGYCTTKIGSGECVDANRNRFNYCFATSYTLQQCQKMAAKNKNIIGIEHGAFEDTSYCFLLFDEKTNAGADVGRLCPSDFMTDDSSNLNRGTGLILDAVAMKGYECFACDGGDDTAVPSHTAAGVKNSQEASTSVLRE